MSRLARLLKQSCYEFVNDGGMDRAAALAFYLIASSLPLLLLAIAGAGKYLGAGDLVAHRIVEISAHFLPGSRKHIHELISTIVESTPVISGIGMATLLFSGSSLFGSLESAMNQAWDCPARSWWRSRLLGLGMTMTAEVLVVMSLALSLLSRIQALSELLLPNWLGWDPWLGVLPYLATFCAYLLMFKLVPNRRVHWRPALCGAVVSSALFELARVAFGFYLDRWSTYNLLYGSLAGLFILVVWSWYVACVTVFGVELASEFEIVYLGIERQKRTRS